MFACCRIARVSTTWVDAESSQRSGDRATQRHLWITPSDSDANNANPKIERNQLKLCDAVRRAPRALNEIKQQRYSDWHTCGTSLQAIEKTQADRAHIHRILMLKHIIYTLIRHMVRGITRNDLTVSSLVKSTHCTGWPKKVSHYQIIKNLW